MKRITADVYVERKRDKEVIVERIQYECETKDNVYREAKRNYMMMMSKYGTTRRVTFTIGCNEYKIVKVEIIDETEIVPV